VVEDEGQQRPNPNLLPAGTNQIRTFLQFYNDESKDPCHRRYERIMRRFDADRPDAPDSATLYQQVVNLGGSTPQAYLLCAETSQGPRIFCVHFPCKYVGALDGEATRWDDKSFAFLGDLVQGMASIVGFPENAFDIVTLRARTEDFILQHLEELNPVLPPEPQNPDDVTIQEIHTRRLAYLPAVYVPLFLSSNGYTIRQAWEILLPALHQRQERETCLMLITWLRAASMGSALPLPLHIGAPAITTFLQAPPADEYLLTHRNQILRNALPHLSAPPHTLEVALSQMAAALITQTNDSRQAREQKAARDLAPKLPSERFTITLPVLLDLLQIPNEVDLPPLWHRWANCMKKQEVQVLQDSLDAYARSNEAFSHAVPIITLRLVQDLLSFTFMGQSADDIKTGLQPFIITDGNAEFRQTNAEVARIYGLINSGDATCSLTDLEVLGTKEVRSVPLTYWEMETSLGMFGNLLGVVIGSNHPLTLAFRDFWLLLKTNVRDDLHAAIEYKGYVKPTHILRSLQLMCYTWFAHRRAHLTPPPTDMKTIINQIIMQIYVLPHLPPQLYHLAYPKKPTSNSLPGSVGTTASLSSGITPSSQSNNSNTSHSNSSNASTVSGLTLQTLPPPTPARGSVVMNQHPIATVQALIPHTLKLKDLIGNSPPPKLDDGGEMCLSFLTRNTCWSNCKRAAHHRSNLTSLEQQRLENYITTRKQLYDARRAAASTANTGLPPDK
jgi:hypothetical protein